MPANDLIFSLLQTVPPPPPPPPPYKRGLPPWLSFWGGKSSPNVGQLCQQSPPGRLHGIPSCLAAEGMTATLTYVSTYWEGGGP